MLRWLIAGYTVGFGLHTLLGDYAIAVGVPASLVVEHLGPLYGLPLIVLLAYLVTTLVLRTPPRLVLTGVLTGFSSAFLLAWSAELPHAAYRMAAYGGCGNGYMQAEWLLCGGCSMAGMLGACLSKLLRLRGGAAGAIPVAEV